MDFKQEMIAFEEFLKTHQIPPLAQMLWYKLFLRAYGADWQEGMEIANAELMAQLYLKDAETFTDCKNKLMEHGLICCRETQVDGVSKWWVNSVIQKNA